MPTSRIVFVIDKIEYKYFEFNELVTSFWLIKEFLLREKEVYITTIDKLSLDLNRPMAHLYKTFMKPSSEDIYKESTYLQANLNDFDMIFFRPDPPVNIEYIFATQILDFVDKNRTFTLNSPSGIRKANEKLYINNFPEFVPASITTSNPDQIREFVNQHGEAVLKPLNRCFGKGVFYLKKGDKNLNTIIETATDHKKTPVIVQEYLKKANNQDKRVIMIAGECYEECLIKLSSEEDFKFTNHRDQFLKKAELTERERHICSEISGKLMEDGLYMVGLDTMDDRIIEINVTSPCFFIKELNRMFGVALEKRIVDDLEKLLSPAYAYSN